MYLYYPDIIKRIFKVWILGYWSFPYFTMKSCQNCDKMLGTHISDFDGLKNYVGILHVGDHVVLIVNVWY